MEREDADTAICCSRSKSVLGMTPHDFCTLSHTVRVDDSTIMVRACLVVYILSHDVLVMCVLCVFAKLMVCVCVC